MNPSKNIYSPLTSKQYIVNSSNSLANKVRDTEQAYIRNNDQYKYLNQQYSEALKQETADISKLQSNLKNEEQTNSKLLQTIGQLSNSSQDSLTHANNFVKELDVANDLLNTRYAYTQNLIKENDSNYKQQLNKLLIQSNDMYNLDNAISGEQSVIEKDNQIYNTKLRKAELSEYNNLKYYSYIEACKIIIAVIIAILFFVGLLQMQLVPSNIGHILIALTIIIGGYFIIQALVNIYYRDNMNYNKYTWDWDSSYTDINNSPPEDIFSYGLNKTFMQTEENDALTESGIDCVGAECCDPKYNTYDSSTNMCQPK